MTWMFDSVPGLGKQVWATCWDKSDKEGRDTKTENWDSYVRRTQTRHGTEKRTSQRGQARCEKSESWRLMFHPGNSSITFLPALWDNLIHEDRDRWFTSVPLHRLSEGASAGTQLAVQLGEKGWHIIPSNLTKRYPYYRSDAFWNTWKVNKKLWPTLLFKTLLWEVGQKSPCNTIICSVDPTSWHCSFALNLEKLRLPGEKKSFSYFVQTTWRLGYKDLGWQNHWNANKLKSCIRSRQACLRRW